VTDSGIIAYFDYVNRSLNNSAFNWIIVEGFFTYQIMHLLQYSFSFASLAVIRIVDSKMVIIAFLMVLNYEVCLVFNYTLESIAYLDYWE
jgi:hypothetical protein